MYQAIIAFYEALLISSIYKLAFHRFVMRISDKYL